MPGLVCDNHCYVIVRRSCLGHHRIIFDCWEGLSSAGNQKGLQDDRSCLVEKGFEKFDLMESP